MGRDKWGATNGARKMGREKWGARPCLLGRLLPRLRLSQPHLELLGAPGEGGLSGSVGGEAPTAPSAVPSSLRDGQREGVLVETDDGFDPSTREALDECWRAHVVLILEAEPSRLPFAPHVHVPLIVHATRVTRSSADRHDALREQLRYAGRAKVALELGS